MASFFDFLDNVAGACERASGHSVVRQAERRSAPLSFVGDVVHREFAVVESTDAATGRPSFVVSNRAGDSAECSSHDFAHRVRDCLG